MVTLCLGVVVAALPEPVDIGRVFTAGERYQYEVRSELTAESRSGNLLTFMPEHREIRYRCTWQVVQMLPDGVARITYQRPTLTETVWEEDRPLVTTDRLDARLEIDLSPTNDFLSVRNLQSARYATRGGLTSDSDPISGFLTELYRLAMFVGSLDAALDFRPRLPFDPVRIGDRWRRTIGYQPQRLAGTERSAVQRIDTEYIYEGLQEAEDGFFHRVTSTVRLDTDLAGFFTQMGFQPEAIGVARIPTRLTTQLTFDLDPRTRRTLRARGTSEGGFEIHRVGQTRPEVETRLRGRSELNLLAYRSGG